MGCLINVEVPVRVVSGTPTFGVFPLDLGDDDRPLSDYYEFIAKMLGVNPGTIATRRWQLQYGTGMNAFGYTVGNPLSLASTLRRQGIHGVFPDAGASAFPGANTYAPTIRLVDLDDTDFVVRYPNDPFGTVTLPDRNLLS